MSDVFSEAIRTQSEAPAAPETPESTPAQTPVETPAQVAEPGKQDTSTQAPAPSTEPQPAAPKGAEPTIDELKAQLAKRDADAAHWQKQYQDRVRKEQEEKVRRSIRQTSKPQGKTDPDEEFDGTVGTLQAKIADGVSQALRDRDLSEQTEKTAAAIDAVAKEHELPDEEVSGIYDMLYRYRLTEQAVLKDDNGMETLYKPTSIQENETLHKLVIRGLGAEKAIAKAKEAGYAEGWKAREQGLKSTPVPTQPATPDQVAVSPEQAAEDAKWKSVRDAGRGKLSLG